jgi:predicted 3-demethylubiquinone-9 3-methyltransferase (glyoxalase superfamily)
MTTITQKITTHLWFEKEVERAAEFYRSVFTESLIKDCTRLYDTPSGPVDIVTMEILGQEFTLIGAGPLFRFNPSVSFLVACKTKEEVAAIWEKLAKDGTALMELGEYPFSEKYGWIQDRFGLSWQVMFMGGREINQRIIPTLMFTDQQWGKTEEAINYYVSVFRGSSAGDILRYGQGEEPDRAGTVKHAAFTLEGREFAAMDSARVHRIPFNEAISFMVHCDNQSEIDDYWDKLSADPEAERCGWLKDRYGLSWQIVPTALAGLLKDGDETKKARVTAAFLKMRKLDIGELKKAYEG